MENETRLSLLNELENLTISMDIPVSRRKDYHWLIRNVHINNRDNKRIDKIIKICLLLRNSYYE